MNEQTTFYEIKLKGTLPAEWSEWFDHTLIRLEPDGITTLICQAVDQAALHGILDRVRDLGIPLICLRQVTSMEEQ